MENLQEINQKYAEIAVLKQYLASTDHHILKQAEGDYRIPPEILLMRSEARESINSLENKILLLEMEVTND